MNQVKRHISTVLLVSLSVLACGQSNKVLTRIVRFQDTLKLKSLIDEGFDINTKFNHHSYWKDDYLLNSAVLFEKRELTEFILRQPGAKHQLVEKDKNTTLHRLVRSGWYDLAKRLVESGVDPNTLGRKDFHILRMVLNNYGWTNNPNELHNTEALAFIIYLYSNGIDPSLSVACCKKKITILGYSVQTRHYQTVEFMLSQHRESINDANYKGKTPLHWAVENGQTKIVELLLKEGANPNLMDKKGKTPIDYALELEDKELIEVLKKASNKA